MLPERLASAGTGAASLREVLHRWALIIIRLRSVPIHTREQYFPHDFPYLLPDFRLNPLCVCSTASRRCATVGALNLYLFVVLRTQAGSWAACLCPLYICTFFQPTWPVPANPASVHHTSRMSLYAIYPRIQGIHRLTRLLCFCCFGDAIANIRLERASDRDVVMVRFLRCHRWRIPLQ